MILTEDLRLSILQAAIEGKLTEQSVKDTPVETTLNKLLDIKKNLVKNKKITETGTITEDSIPFNIPENWAWVKLCDIGELARGKSKHRPRNDESLYINGTIPMIQTGDVAAANKYITHFNTCYNEKGLAQSRLWKKGTLCITIAANIGDVAILTFDACFPDSVLGFLPFSEQISREYVYYMLLAYKHRMNAKASKVAQSNLSLDKINAMLFPFPPIEEQQRIANHLNTLLYKVGEYEEIEQQLTALKNDFPSDMRSSILQAAMQGKLTQQLETDSSVDIMLQSIIEDKKMYINYHNEAVQIVQDSISTALPDINNLNRGLTYPIYQVIPYGITEDREKDILQLMPHCKQTRWHSLAIDIIPANGGKENGIREVLKYYQINPEETMAFGDGWNDVDMFEFCKIGIAMGNADDDVKKKANYITKDIDDDGIYHALKHFHIL